MNFPFSTGTLLSQSANRNTADRLMELLSRRPALLQEEIAGALSISPSESDSVIHELRARGRIELRGLRGGAVAVSAKDF